MIAFTLGICVTPNSDRDKVLDLIHSAQYFDFEVILVGGGSQAYGTERNVSFIPFHEGYKPGWITRKKNIIASAAACENLCIVHDYYEFDYRWASEMAKYDQQNPWWKVICTPVLTQEGHRHSDWVVNPDAMMTAIERKPEWAERLMRVAPYENHPKYVCGLPYEVTDLSHIQYISGGYIVVKREVLRRIPFDQTLTWGQAEDVEWSSRLNKANIRFNFNPNSIIYANKPGKWRVSQMPDDFVSHLRSVFGSS